MEIIKTISMKRQLFLTAALLFSLTSTVSAQFKVVDKSSKKAPTWYQQMVADYLIVSAHEPTLEEAQAACLHYTSSCTKHHLFRIQ